MSGPSRLVTGTHRAQRTWASTSAWRLGASAGRASSSSTATATSSPALQHQVQTPPPPKAPRTKVRATALVDSGLPLRRRDQRERDALTEFRIAIAARDVEDSWTVWQKVRETGQIRLLSHEEILELTRLIEGDQGSQERLIELSNDLFQERKWTPLSDCLKAHLRAGQGDAILEIAAKVLPVWREIHSTNSITGVTHPLVEDVVTLSAIVCARKEKPDVTPLIRLVRPLFPSFVPRAGALHKTRGDASQGNGSGLTIHGAIRVLKELSPDAASAQLPFTFCRHAILAWGMDCDVPASRERTERNEASTSSLNVRLISLFNSNDTDSVKLLLDTALEAKEAEYGSWLTMATQRDAIADWNDDVWSTLLCRSIKKGYTQLAAQIWTAYTTLKPANEASTANVWNALLSGYAESRQWNSVQSTWQHMLATNRPTDPIDLYSYTTMMTALFESWRPSEALLIFEDLKEKVAKGQLQWNSVVFTALVHGLCINKRIEEANVIFRDMIKGKFNYPKPTIGIINVFLRIHAKRGELENLVDTLKTMSDLGMEPDKYTFNTVMNAFVRKGRQGAVKDVVVAMQQAGVESDTVTFSTLIMHHLLGEDGNMVDFKSALDVLYKMEHEGPIPTSITYTTVIKALFEHFHEFEVLCKTKKLRLIYAKALQRYMVKQRADSTETGEPALSSSASFALVLLDRMRNRDLRPTRVTYHVLIAGLFQQQQHAQANQGGGTTALGLTYLKRAMSLLDECCAGPGPNASTWIIGLRGLIEQSTNNDRIVALQARKHLADVIALVNQSEYHRTHADVIDLIEQAAQLASSR